MRTKEEWFWLNLRYLNEKHERYLESRVVYAEVDDGSGRIAPVSCPFFML